MSAALEITRTRAAFPSELTIGRRIEYRGSWGRAVPQDGEITDGPVYVGTPEEPTWGALLDNGDRRWGYLEQFCIEEAR